MAAPDTHKTRLRQNNWSACGAGILLVIAIWLAIHDMRVSAIGAAAGVCGDCGRNDALIAGTDLNTTIEWITFRSDG